LLGNENINVAIRDDGFRYWGGLTCSSDSKYKFETTVRIYTMVMDSLLDARRRLADRPFTANVVKQIIRSCDSYIRTLQSREALIAGRCFADPDLNTSDRVMLGKAYFNLDLTVPTPMHDVTFGLTLGTDGYDSIFEV
jgi:phage tail sheath protein FI